MKLSQDQEAALLALDAGEAPSLDAGRCEFVKCELASLGLYDRHAAKVTEPGHVKAAAIRADNAPPEPPKPIVPKASEPEVKPVTGDTDEPLKRKEKRGGIQGRSRPAVGNPDRRPDDQKGSGRPPA